MLEARYEYVASDHEQCIARVGPWDVWFWQGTIQKWLTFVRKGEEHIAVPISSGPAHRNYDSLPAEIVAYLSLKYGVKTS